MMPVGPIRHIRLLKTNKGIVQIKNLKDAIEQSILPAVQYCLENSEEDINELDSNGYTPLARAVEKQHLEIVKYLVSKEADVCKAGRNGKTPLCLAVEAENLQMISFLLENGAKHTVQSAFLSAIQTKKTEIISMLQEKGARVNYTYLDGQTPLTKAIEIQDPIVTKYLIDNGADVQIVINDETNSYFMKCVKNKSLDMVKVLCEAGCNLDRPGECGYTPLTKATELDKFSIVRCLIEHGAKINCFDDNKKTALAIAASNCSFRNCRYLIDSGADIQLAQPEVDDYGAWNDDFARYLAPFKLKPKSEETSFSPGKNETNQAKVCPHRWDDTDDSDSDDLLVKKRRQETNETVSYNIQELQIEKKARECAELIDKNLNKPRQTKARDEERRWEIMEKAILEAREKSIDRRQQKKKWWDEECEEELEKKNKLGMEMVKKRDNESIIQHNRQRKKLKLLCREKCRLYNS